MIKLPTEKRPPRQVNPGILVIYSAPKAGKTAILAKLNNCLIINLDDSGADYYESLAIDVIGLDAPKKEKKEQREERHKTKKYYFTEVIDSLRNNNSYDYVALDTATKLEEWCILQATKNYMRSAQGKNFNRYSVEDQNKGQGIKGTVKPFKEWESVLSLDYGAGYTWLRGTYKFYLESLYGVSKWTIVTAHVKDSMLTTKEGKEVNHKDLNLVGKVKDITCSRADAIGYFYREEKRGYLNFMTDETITCGTRPPHLVGKKILISEEKEGEIVTYWDRIYLNN